MSVELLTRDECGAAESQFQVLSKLQSEVFFNSNQFAYLVCELCQMSLRVLTFLPIRILAGFRDNFCIELVAVLIVILNDKVDLKSVHPQTARERKIRQRFSAQSGTGIASHFFSVLPH